MSCPPGKFRNPKTGLCIDSAGRTARKLVKDGNIADYYYRPAPVHQLYTRRQTVRKARTPTLAAAFGIPGAHRTVPCKPDEERNPMTGHCIKKTGKTYKRLYGAPALAPAPAAPAAAAPKLTHADVRRKTNSEGPIVLPVGSAGVAPLLDKPSILGWAHAQCKNDRDPISGIPFASADTAALQDLIRLHNRTCVMAGPLNAKVAAEHKAGAVATIPGDPQSHMTLDDFIALRNVMRRHDPAYKIPSRRHQPPPANWQLYIASDNRSGPDFASVHFVDVRQIVQGPAGPEYPVESVMLDLGFIPLKVTGAICSPQTIVGMIQQLATTNRLLTPVAGGWKPIAGFPYSKKYWTTDTKERFSKLCRELAKAISSPL